MSLINSITTTTGVPSTVTGFVNPLSVNYQRFLPGSYEGTAYFTLTLNSISGDRSQLTLYRILHMQSGVKSHFAIATDFSRITFHESSQGTFDDTNLAEMISVITNADRTGNGFGYSFSVSTN